MIELKHVSKLFFQKVIKNDEKSLLGEPALGRSK